MTCLPYSFVEDAPKDGADRPSESFDLENGSVSANRYFRGPWDNRLDFVFEYLMGGATNGANLTNLTSPQRHPYLKGCFVNKIDIVGLGVGTYDAENERSSWERCKITVGYAKRAANQGDTTDNEENNIPDWLFIDESLDSHVEMLSVPGKDVLIGQEKGHEVGFINKIVPTLTLIIKQKAIISPQWGGILNCLGKVNQQVFISSSGLVVPRGTGRYDGPSAFTRVNAFDRSGILEEDFFPVPLWEVSHRFEIQKFGWNNHFKDGVWAAILPPLYEEVDFWTIFFGAAPKPAGFDANLNQLQALSLLLNQAIADFGFASPQVQAIIVDINAIKTAMGFKS